MLNSESNKAHGKLWQPSQLRLARSGDLETLLLLYRRVIEWMDASGLHLWSSEGVTCAWLTEAISADALVTLEIGGSMAAAIYVDDKASAYWPSEGANDYLYARRLCVHPQWHGRGLGRALLEHLVDTCRHSGKAGLRFDCADRMRLVRYYESLGFRTVGHGTDVNYHYSLQERLVRPGSAITSRSPAQHRADQGHPDE